MKTLLSLIAHLFRPKKHLKYIAIKIVFKD